MADLPSSRTVSPEPRLKVLDLSCLPPIYVFPAHMSMLDLHALEDQLTENSAPLTYDPSEAQIFIGKVMQKRRVLLELRNRNVFTEEVFSSFEIPSVEDVPVGPPQSKRQQSVDGAAPPHGHQFGIQDSSTESETEGVRLGKRKRKTSDIGRPRDISELVTTAGKLLHMQVEPDAVQVVKLSWFEDSFAAGKLLSFKDYVVYTGKRASSQAEGRKTFGTPTVPVSPESCIEPTTVNPPSAASILARAQAELQPTATEQPSSAFKSTTQLSKRIAQSSHRPAHLVHQTTSEHDLGQSHDLPEMPDWVRRHSTYSCERRTLLHTPNDAFVAELKKIRLARELIADDIGVRAYSTSIASIQAYPYTLTDSRELLALPGCDHKIASLWAEWKNVASTGRSIMAVADAEADEHLKILRLFYDIWGVGAHTAREFYNRGWRDLDDVVEFGWAELSRVQQIGVKFYDEFLLKIPRREVEFIAAKVHEHAQRVREPTGVRTCIVGGYRRGKEESGDVDIIVSHMDEDATLEIVTDVVKSLFDEGWITHELTTSLSNTRRSQSTLPYRPDGGGHGFDTLDKSLVVWQDPNYPNRDTPGMKNPNVHRRVDIIIAPWSKVGCAVLGWTAATTFERDLRRYAKRFKGWKFDSSGIRDRKTGEDIDLESVGGKCTTVEEAERKVFAGFGLEWREPWERCAG